MQYVLVPILCIWVLSNNNAVPHHAVVVTCLSTAKWEVARVLCNGCCVYTYVCTYSA